MNVMVRYVPALEVPEKERNAIQLTGVQMIRDALDSIKAEKTQIQNKLETEINNSDNVSLYLFVF